MSLGAKTKGPGEGETPRPENDNTQNTDEINPRLAALQEALWAFTDERPRDQLELAMLATGALLEQRQVVFRWFAELILERAIETLEEETAYAGRSAAHFRQMALRREKYTEHHGRWPDPAAAGLRYVEFALARVRDHMAEAGPFEAKAYAVAAWLRLSPRERRELTKATEARDEN